MIERDAALVAILGPALVLLGHPMGLAILSALR